MGKKIFRAICLTALLVLVVSTVLFMAVLYGNLEAQTIQTLRTEAVYISHALQTEGMDYLEDLPDKTRRITLVDSRGVVLYDNTADAASMENHLEREEIREALRTGRGDSERMSQTLATKTLYHAVRLPNGLILRLSATQQSVWALLLALMQPAALVILLLFGGSAWLAGTISQKLLAPINSLDLEHPERNQVYEELAPLLSNTARLHRTIDAQLAQARQKQEEFRLITDHMAEGILVLDSATNLLSHNGAAQSLLGLSAVPDNPSVLAWNRTEVFRNAIRTALSGSRTEGILEMADKTLRLIANPVKNGETVDGAVLLVLDITESAQREALRREFSANVSHELKTPLTSISGFAELMQTGMVAPADVVDFSRSIYDEAQQLIGLVEDIISLSKLDEGDLHREMTRVDLYALAQEQAKRLRPQAEKVGVTMTVQGSPMEILGSRPVLTEMVYNLCENAVKYNRPGGTVTVTVSDGMLTVRDTGIGIPVQSQSRVFERFYRVDKSHSADVPGTGLGLSIVKHGAALHQAKIALESQEGTGTAVTVTFPKR